jgi:hypothetical protein
VKVGASGTIPCMATDSWLPLTSLAGVVLGGGLSFAVQYSTQRAAERAAERKQALDLSEARRAERLAHLQRFIEVSGEAERIGFTRPVPWTEADVEWHDQAQETMNRLWVAERMLRLFFPLPVHDAALAYSLHLNRFVWEELAEGESIAEPIEDSRLKFLDAGRAAID